MFDNAMFLRVMSDIGIEINEEIKDGKFSKLVIKKETMTINMCLSFPKVISVDTLVFLKSIKIQSYIYAAVLTFVFAVIMRIFTYFKLKKINMIESLKSVE